MASAGMNKSKQMLGRRLLSVTLTLLPLSGCLGDLDTEAELDKRLEALDVPDGALADAPTETTDAQVDTMPADATPTDAELPDVATTDTTPEPCPGADGCDCTSDSECRSGACIPTPQGVRCAATCEGSCEAGSACTPVPVNSGGTANVCVPNWLTLCDPCDTSEACHHPGDPDAACVGPTAQGSFCGASCDVSGDCPPGYACEMATTVEGGTSKQCRRLPSGSDPQGEPGACPCSKLASQLQRSTSCERGAGSELGPGCRSARATTATPAPSTTSARTASAARVEPSHVPAAPAHWPTAIRSPERARRQTATTEPNATQAMRAFRPPSAQAESARAAW